MNLPMDHGMFYHSAILVFAALFVCFSSETWIQINVEHECAYTETVLNSVKKTKKKKKKKKLTLIFFFITTDKQFSSFVCLSHRIHV